MNYSTLRYQTAKYAIRDTIKDGLHQWTGQGLTSYKTNAVLYILIGPIKFFSTGYNGVVPFGLLFGFVAPFCLLLYRLFPKCHFDLWNVTIFALQC